MWLKYPNNNTKFYLLATSDFSPLMGAKREGEGRSPGSWIEVEPYQLIGYHKKEERKNLKKIPLMVKWESAHPNGISHAVWFRYWPDVFFLDVTRGLKRRKFP